MNNASAAILAGFIATVALSVLMVLKTAMGIMPQLDVIGMLTRMANNMMGLPATPVVGWVIHFMVGALVYGVVFANLKGSLPGQSAVVKGMVLAIIFWLVMMIILMPMAGAGFFGMGIGIMAPVMTLVLHLIFGAVLGWSYGLLRGTNSHESVSR